MNNKRGYILISLLMFFTIISLILLSLHRYVMMESLKVQEKYENTRAYYMAESAAILYSRKITAKVSDLAHEHFEETTVEDFENCLYDYFEELHFLLSDHRFWTTESPQLKSYSDEYSIKAKLVSLDETILYKATGIYGNNEISYYVKLSKPIITLVEGSVMISGPEIISYFQGY